MDFIGEEETRYSVISVTFVREYSHFLQRRKERRLVAVPLDYLKGVFSVNSGMHIIKTNSIKISTSIQI